MASLPPDAARRFRDRLRTAIGFDNASAGIIASAFRAATRLREDGNGPRRCRASVPIALRTGGPGENIFCNLTSQLTLTARTDEVRDWASLTRALSGQMRRQIRERRDAAVVRTMIWLGRDYRVTRSMLERFWEPDATLGYGFHGKLPPEVRSLFGSRIQRFLTVDSPSGLPMLSVNEVNGFTFSLTFMTEALRERDARRFLDGLVEDLVEEESAGTS